MKLVAKLSSKYVLQYLKSEKNEEEIATIRCEFTKLYCAVRELQKYSEFE